MANMPDIEATARRRFMIINAMRFGGVLMVMFGIAVLNGLLGLPPIVAYVLIGLGLVETFITPQILARMWSTRNRGPDTRGPNPMPGSDTDADRGHDGRR